ncbi:DoxX family protein [Natronospirillum operosum]|uniref:DoxX family protein n=1 Tax=Natronospirillum operosum TaxID=2759953 RepID=A0A4Z0W9W9_9GAMM|nr:DoxX family protein [Natronospirillum operosum]TGG91066.1 DoxX family protein [Natronospirillum operosum]
MKAFTPVIELIGRALISFMFILSGIDKLGGIEGTQGYMEMMGVPGILIYPTIALEILAGLAVLVGFHTRIAAFLLAGFSIVSGLLFHFDLSNQAEVINLMKNFTIAGGFAFLVAHGAGKISIDARR